MMFFIVEPEPTATINQPLISVNKKTLILIKRYLASVNQVNLGKLYRTCRKMHFGSP